MKALVVRHAFGRGGVDYPVGAIIRDAAKVAEIADSDHQQHVVQVDLPPEPTAPAPAAAT